MNRPTISNCHMVELPRIPYRAGNITTVSNEQEIPFAIRRIFYIYDIPGGVDRGAHAHRTCHQFLIAASGSFEIELDDGMAKRTVMLNRPYFGLHVPPGIWAAEKGFSSGAICLVLNSHLFDEGDYIRDYADYLNFVGPSSLDPSVQI